MSSSKETLQEVVNLPANSPTVNKKNMSVFSNMQMFESAQRMAKLLSSSNLIPDQYQNNIANTTIALEMAQRIGASPLAVMQNLYIVHGKPGWSAVFIIASLNTCGRYSPIRFEMKGEGDKAECKAWAYDLNNNNERIEGPTVSIAMAMLEGWFQRKGSKWQTMPDVMLRYRAASFFGKLYAPEIMMGMQTAEELHDIIDLSPNSNGEYETPTKGVDGVKSKLKQHTQNNHAMDAISKNTTVVDNNLVDTSTGEIIDKQPMNTDTQQQEQEPTKNPTANDTLKTNLENKQSKGRATNTKNSNPDQF